MKTKLRNLTNVLKLHKQGFLTVQDIEECILIVEKLQRDKESLLKVAKFARDMASDIDDLILGQQIEAIIAEAEGDK